MKQIFFSLIHVALSVLSFAQGNIPDYSIIISDFSPHEFIEFNRDSNIPITAELVKKGFFIAIESNIKIDSLTVLNEDSEYTRFTSDNPTKLTGYATYTMSDIYTDKNKNEVLIKIHEGNKSALITLKVKPETDGSNTSGNNQSPCTRFVSKTRNSECDYYEENFGENVDLFTEQTIVYVYDYNVDPSKRVFYKFTKKSDALHKEIVNFNKETLTADKNVRFKIYNINKFMYDVSITDSLVQFESEPPALFNEFFLGDKDGLLGSLMKTVSDGTVAKNNVKEEEANKLLKNISCFIENYNALRDIALDAYKPCKSYHCCQSIDYAAFLTLLSQIKAQKEVVGNKLIEEKASLQKISSAKESCFKQIRLKSSIDITIKNNEYSISKLNLIIEDLLQKDASLKNEIAKIKMEIKSLESQIYFSSGADSLTKKAQLSRLEIELPEKKAELTSNNTKLIAEQTKRLDLEIEKNKLLNSLDSVKIEMSLACDNSIQNTMNKIEDMIYTLEIANYLLDNLPNEEELKEHVIFVNNMVAQNYIHTKDFISLNGNMLDLTLSISSKDSSAVKKLTGIKVDEHIPIQIPIIWKPLVSFSTGTFIAIGSNMQNKVYAWQETNGSNNTINSDSYTLVESGFTSKPLGFSALGNLQWKVSRSFGFGGSVGVGLTIEELPRIAYLGGISLFLGELRQFAITGGFAGMQVNRLTNNFQSIVDNQVIYTAKPDDIKYYNEFKVGGFISLSYTPFKIYKTKTVKSKIK